MGRKVSEQRVIRHARRGYALALTDDAYRARVSERLAPALVREANDMWEAIDWTWACMLGLGHPRGPLATEIEHAAKMLERLLVGEDIDAITWAKLTEEKLSLGSTLRSHPFPDQAAWLLQRTSHAS